MAAKIKKGDNVVVLTGKDKGRTGTVSKVMPKDNRVLVGGVNMVQRHTKPTQGDPQGGIKHKEAALHVSNVAIVDSKGKQGAVTQVLPKENRVVVGGVNMVSRHTKATQADPQGGIKNKEAALHVSNVALVDSNGKATRVGFRMDGDKKVRFAKSTGETING